MYVKGNILQAARELAGIAAHFRVKRRLFARPSTPAILQAAIDAHRQTPPFVNPALGPAAIVSNMNETALHRAAAYGTRQECEALLNTPGTDINAKDDWNATPLHYAASKNNVEIVELLLRRGASVNVRMTNGTTPLGTALTQLQRGHYIGFGDNPTPPQIIVSMLRSRGGVE